MHHWLHTGEQKQKFYEDVVAYCPVCCAEKETWTRIFQCPHKDAEAIGTMALTKFQLVLIAMKMAPIIQQVLYYEMDQWCKLICGDIPQIPADNTGKILCSAIELQVQIGWGNFIEGHVAKQWSCAQKSYRDALPTNMTVDSTQWTTKLIKAV
eukprot:9836751-Ditylum_brightwellii.AAC.1